MVVINWMKILQIDNLIWFELLQKIDLFSKLKFLNGKLVESYKNSQNFKMARKMG